MGDSAVQLLLLDGSKVHIQQDVISRSSVLQQAVATVDDDGDALLILPTGVLQTWLQSLEAFKGAQRAQTAFDIPYPPQLLQFMKV